MIHAERPHCVVCKSGRVLLVEGCESYAVEPRNTLLCPQPDVVILGLDNGLHRILRQSLFSNPHVTRVLSDCLIGIQRINRPAEKQNADQPPCPSSHVTIIQCPSAFAVLRLYERVSRRDAKAQMLAFVARIYYLY